ncbi:MAG: hypothetical protein PHI37_02955 [Candidatus Gracilibacteria bacterium]|nr:hypothetical protein [Candidatus Gracilibacteria bacterium]
MSLEKQKFSEVPKPISSETRETKEAKVISSETREKLKTISSREFLKIPENERLRYITKLQIDSTKISSGEIKEMEFNFTFDSKFNRELYLKTTAGQVLPKEVREVKVGDETYTRVGLKGEFFNSKNTRLTIHQDTKLEISKLGDVKELEMQNQNIFTSFKSENKANKDSGKDYIDLETINYDDLLKGAIDKGIDPGFAIFAFGDEIKSLTLLSIDRQVKLEDLLTTYYRVKNNFPEWNGNILEESEQRDNFVLALLKETSSNWKEKAKDYGIKEEKIERYSRNVNQKISFDLSILQDGDRGLLDFISHAEGTNLNYNAIFGNGNQNKIDFTSMSLGEILNYQSEYKRKMGSAAIGKYQFMDYTLRDMINRYDISKDEKFTPEMQDKLAYIKLQEKGLNDFKNGIISKSDFQFRLSQEWSSIAKNDSGLSYYHGDSMNNHASKAGKSVREVLDKLYA